MHALPKLYCTFVDVFVTLSGMLILQAHRTAAGAGGEGGGEEGAYGGVVTLSCTHALFSVLFSPILIITAV